MSEDNKGKDKEKGKQKQNNDANIKQDSTETGSIDNPKRNTRTSNVKEMGFYKFASMMTRNIKSQAKSNFRKVKKRSKNRMKIKSLQK